MLGISTLTDSEGLVFRGEFLPVPSRGMECYGFWTKFRDTQTFQTLQFSYLI